MSQARIDRMLDDVRVRDYGKLAVLTIAAALGAVIVTFTGVTSSELAAGEGGIPARAAEAFPSFPAQYINQATEPAEHIQAF